MTERHLLKRSGDALVAGKMAKDRRGGQARRTMARVQLARSDFGEAETLARAALGLLEPTDYVVNRISALATLAAVQRAAGDETAAGEALARAQLLAEAKGIPLVVEPISASVAPEPSQVS